MKKRVLSVLMALSLMVGMLPTVALAAEVTSGNHGENLTWNLSEDGTLTITGTGEMAECTPAPWEDTRSEIQTIKINEGVTTIASEAFRDCSNLSSVTIPTSVTTIGEWAFMGCPNLHTITIPAGVTSVDPRAFGDYDNYLTEIKVVDGNTAYSDIDGILFNKEKTELVRYPAGKTGTSYSIPTNVTTIGEAAFWSCDNLTSITVPVGVTTIEQNAFSVCANLSTITLPDGLTTIGAQAFWKCDKLTSIKLPASVTEIKVEAFSDCAGLSEITIPASVTLIDNCGGLRSCENLTAITVDPNNTTYSSQDGVLFNKSQTELLCYPDNKAGTSYSVPDNVAIIAGAAFDGCNLSSITLPTSLKSIQSSNSFGKNLTDIYYSGSQEEWSKITLEGYSSNLFASLTIHYSEESSEVGISKVGFAWTAEEANTQYKAARVAVDAEDSAAIDSGDQTVWVVLEEKPTDEGYTIAFSKNGQALFGTSEGVEMKDNLGLSFSFLNSTQNATDAVVKAGDEITVTYSKGNEVIDEEVITVEAPETALEFRGYTSFNKTSMGLAMNQAIKGDYWVDLKDGSGNVVLSFSTSSEDNATDQINKEWAEELAEGAYLLEFSPAAYHADGSATAAIPNAVIDSMILTTEGFHIINITEPTNGTVTVDAIYNAAAAGTKVTITATPANGYVVDTITVKDYQEGAVTVTGNSFEMPDKDIKLTVTFKKAPSGGGGGGGGSSSTSKPTTSTTTNPDGSTTTTTTDKKTGTVTEVTENTDGSTTTVETKKDGTVTTTEEAADGTVTETVEAPDGSVTTTVEDAEGNVTETVENTDGSVETTQTLSDGTTIATVTDANGETTADISLGDDYEDGATVTIPVADLPTGAVAIIVHEDGTEEIVSTSVVTEDGLLVPLTEGASLKIVDNSQDFGDVSSSDWHSDAVDFVSSRNIFNGTGEGQFSPNSTMNRAMVAQVLYNLNKNPEAGEANFGDVSGDKWYADAAAWASENGIVNGYEDGSFRGEASVSREQLAVMLWRYAGEPASSHDLDHFSDAGQISDYAKAALAWANENGIINGTSSDSVSPKNDATRAQVAQMMKNFIEWMVK